MTRAIVSAQIELQFRSQMKEIVGAAADTPFWKAESGFNSLNQKMFDSYNQIYRERARLMREVLGDEYFASSSGEATAIQRRQYGDIPKAKIDLVQRINDDYTEMTAQVRVATQGVTLPEDRDKIALLEKEKRADLAAILSPQELEDYLMHTSQVTMRLRTPLSIMDATEAEFRALYQIQQKYQDAINYGSASLGAGMTITAEMSQQRTAAMKQMNEEIKGALGETRAAEYIRASDSEFQGLYRMAQRDNLPPDAAVRAYTMRDSIAQQSMQIVNDHATPVEQRQAALQTLAQSAKAQLIGVLGVDVGNSYAKSARWLNYIEQGRGVSFSESGTMMSRPITQPRPIPANPPRG
jgi:hypothetical protein